MRNMSFAITTKAMKNGTKDVTRRFGWWFLKAGDRVMAVEKGMGLKKSEKIKRLYPIEIISTRCETLNSITKAECIREGFPDFEPEDFVAMMCRLHKDVNRITAVNRIEFKRIERTKQ